MNAVHLQVSYNIAGTLISLFLFQYNHVRRDSSLLGMQSNAHAFK